MIGRNGIAGLFSVNRSVTDLVSSGRRFQLPTLNFIPKLDPGATRLVAGGAVAAGSLPEMVSDLLDESTVYAVANVRRDHTRLPGLVGRVWDAGRREARP